jgi:cytoskeletal protein RodZ
MSNQEENILTLGQLLKQEREKMGITIEKASKILMVRHQHIINLENDMYDSFPAGVYFKGFIRNYARLLGLDENIVFEYYKCQLEVMDVMAFKINPPKEEPPSQPTNNYPYSSSSYNQTSYDKNKKNKFSLVITWDLILKLIGILIFAVIAFYLYNTFQNISRLPIIEVFEPKNNTTTQEEKIKISGNTSKEDTLQINNDPVQVDANGYFETEVFLMQGINEITINATNKFDKTTTKKLFVNYIPTLETTQNPEQEIIKKVTLKVDSEPVWINVKTPNEEYSETLAANSEKIIEIKEETKITVGKGSAIYFTEEKGDEKELYLNPPTLEIFGESEEKVERTFQP